MPYRYWLPKANDGRDIQPHANTSQGGDGGWWRRMSHGSVRRQQAYTFAAEDAGQHVFLADLETVGTQWLQAVDTVMGSIRGRQEGILVIPV
jgi:hypothetical protein